MTNWHEVSEEIWTTVRDDIASGELDPTDDDAVQEYAHEWADSSQYVIYYSKSRELWADSAEVQAYEDDAKDLSPESLDAWIVACVYLAIHNEILSAIADRDDE